VTESTGTFPAAAAGIRDTAKWLLASFGAVAAVLIAGVQFSGVAALDWPELGWALALGLAGLLGIAWAVTGVAGLLLPQSYTMRELAGARGGRAASVRRALDARPELLRGLGTVAALADELDSRTATYRRAQEAWAAAPADGREAATRAVDAAVDDLDAVTAVTRSAGDWANYFALRQEFEAVFRWRILPGIALALVGFAGVLLLTADKPSEAAAPSMVTLSGVTVSRGSSIAGARLSGADLSNSTFAGVSLERADLSGANLEGTDLSGANLVSANLLDASMASAKISGVTWGHTTCPDGTNSDAVGGTCEAHLSPATKAGS
jgi:uncharacterized protein YjbI with pentapeptide repeats